ncbi:MAG: hypothetical protein ACTSXA_05995 [Candidatus Heimdallarchaeota archaeon]
MSKKTTKTIKKTTKSTTVKKSSMTKKETDFLVKAKEQLESINKLLSESSIKLPSLVSTQNVAVNSLNGIIQNKYQADAELIGMLEEFFVKMVDLLRLRSTIDEKLSQINYRIKSLQQAKTTGEFRGNLQVLGITLNEAEQVVKNYQDMYTNLFTEQAFLQFQLMEQLLLFRNEGTPEFTAAFDKGMQIFQQINKKISS